MRSIERRFKSILEKNPSFSTYTAFALAIDRKNFSRPMLHRWFNRLVERGDYDLKDKREVLTHLEHLSNEPEDDKKALDFNPLVTFIPKDVSSVTRQVDIVNLTKYTLKPVVLI